MEVVRALLMYYTITVGRPDDKQSHCRTGEECECEELRFRGSPLACGVMCSVSSNWNGHSLSTPQMIYVLKQFLSSDDNMVLFF